jgi:hypothetical protein
MQSKKFYDLVSELGEFRCNKDLRRFNYRAKRNPNWNVNQYLSHFGHCKNGVFHHCDFELKPQPKTQVTYYYKVIEVDGVKIRQKGGRPMNFSGRGRPPRKK